ncbi:periplasmic nitrate reductase maturation protein NapF [Sphaerotilus hippei]|uniref:Periplasmic nitrate reductase maturation protein NapF n=1 Tax=Sphaerotilus hippei TaxID=744406 RepID=A0A318H3K3_9BURK|nr:ferredoxin-type protein NapF [Sphaerotilus hippei]PXW93381.1 periplasmic nitrate reductase maturation protein NapF [Sphaerotilus hippei]
MDPRRRSFLRGALREATAAAPPPAPPRPPWALTPDARFTERCTRCGDCSRACPVQLIHPGDGGFPRIDFQARGCDECGACSRACPTGAIAPAGSVPAFVWRVEVDRQRCLGERQVECRICAEACDTGALRCVPALGGISRLRLDTEACTGCGACVAPCPVQALSMVAPAAAPDR